MTARDRLQGIVDRGIPDWAGTRADGCDRCRHRLDDDDGSPCEDCDEVLDLWSSPFEEEGRLARALLAVLDECAALDTRHASDMADALVPVAESDGDPIGNTIRAAVDRELSS